MDNPQYFVTMSEVVRLCESIVAKLVQKWTKYDIVYDIWRGGTMTHLFLTHTNNYKYMQESGRIHDHTIVYHSHCNEQEGYAIPGISLQENENVLIVEDLLDTGETIRDVYNKIRDVSPRCNIDIACLYVKGWKQHADLLTDHRLQFICGETRSQEEWIKFPWEPGGEIEKNNILNNEKTVPYEKVKGTPFDPKNIKLEEYREQVTSEGLTDTKKVGLKGKIAEKWK